MRAGNGAGSDCDNTADNVEYRNNYLTIPVTAKEPEAAMKFLNMMYTDERIVNLLNYGIENEDYIVDEDGRFSYPEGKDMNSVGYYNGYTWLFGNQFLAGVRDNEDADIREKGKAATLRPAYPQTLVFLRFYRAGYGNCRNDQRKK